MTHDRVDSDTFELTQLFLSQMLGVRRAGVTVAAGALQQLGLITYNRGAITIVDREGLEDICCECYGIIRSEFARLLEGRNIPSPLDDVRVSEEGKSTAESLDTNDPDEERVTG